LEAVEEEEQDEVSGEHTRRSLRRAAARTGRESIRKLVDQINHMQDENPQADKTILATMEDDDDDDDDDYVAEAKDDECSEGSSWSSSADGDEGNGAAMAGVRGGSVLKKRRGCVAKPHRVWQVQVGDKTLLLRARPLESNAAEAGRVVVLSTRRM